VPVSSEKASGDVLRISLVPQYEWIRQLVFYAEHSYESALYLTARAHTLAQLNKSVTAVAAERFWPLFGVKENETAQHSVVT